MLRAKKKMARFADGFCYFGKGWERFLPEILAFCDYGEHPYAYVKGFLLVLEGILDNYDVCVNQRYLAGKMA